MADYSKAKRYRVIFKDGGSITVTARTEAEARKVAVRMVKDHKKYTGGKASTSVDSVNAGEVRTDKGVRGWQND